MSDLKIYAKTLEQTAKEQIEAISESAAFSDSKIRIMPDCHAGKGTVIGFTANMTDKVIPNVVGVDIGCGMLTANLGPLAVDFAKLDEVIRTYVPSGFNVHEVPVSDTSFLQRLKCYPYLHDVDWLEKSLGSLGGGNHFIELDQDEDGNVYLIIHSGSRNLGVQVASYYQDLAIKNCQNNKSAREELIREYKAAGRQKEISNALAQIPVVNIPKELCYLEGQDRKDYLHDMEICQNFASINREAIAEIICLAMGWEGIDSFETIHNYISFKDGIVRKGAISAHYGERVLIPLNMRDGCILGTGLGNEDWNNSAPHGAGRVMSRKQAKELINLEDFQNTMEGIYSTSIVEETLDESPFAYKPSEEIIELVKDTVRIEKILKPIYNFKAS